MDEPLPPSKRKTYVRPAFEVFHSPSLPTKSKRTISRWLDKVTDRLGHRHQQPEATAELAFEIIAFGRMRAFGQKTVVIEVPEVADHLRESPRHIRQSLRLLELAGVAKPTPSKDHWKLAA